MVDILNNNVDDVNKAVDNVAFVNAVATRGRRRSRAEGKRKPADLGERAGFV